MLLMGALLTRMSSVERIRRVVDGVGAGVFAMHRGALAAQTELEVVGACDINAEVGGERAAQFGWSFYPEHRPLLHEMRPDLAVILAPHPLHASIALDCFAAGCHVLVEKPIAVQVAEADAMIAAADQAGRLLAVNFQQSHRPEIRA